MRSPTKQTQQSRDTSKQIGFKDVMRKVAYYDRERRGHTQHHERRETKADLDVKVRIDRDWNRGGFDL